MGPCDDPPMRGEPWVCDYCGADMPRDGLWLKVRRDAVHVHGLPDLTELEFCTEEHVAAFFAEDRLPPAEHVVMTPGETPIEWKERLGCAAAALAILSMSALVVIGLYTVGRWLWW